MRGHRTQQGSTAGAHVDIQSADAGSHSQRLSDVKGLFGVVTGRSDTVDRGAIGGNALDPSGSFLFRILVVVVYVRDMESGDLQQPDGLALAGERFSFVVSRSHVAAAKRGSGAGPCRGRRLRAGRFPASCVTGDEI